MVQASVFKGGLESRDLVFASFLELSEDGLNALALLGGRAEEVAEEVAFLRG